MARTLLDVCSGLAAGNCCAVHVTARAMATGSLAHSAGSEQWWKMLRRIRRAGDATGAGGAAADEAVACIVIIVELPLMRQDPSNGDYYGDVHALVFAAWGEAS